MRKTRASGKVGVREGKGGDNDIIHIIHVCWLVFVSFDKLESLGGGTSMRNRPHQIVCVAFSWWLIYVLERGPLWEVPFLSSWSWEV